MSAELSQNLSESSQNVSVLSQYDMFSQKKSSQNETFLQKKESILEKIENCVIFFQKSLLGYPRPTLYVSGLDESHALEIGRFTHYRFACVFTILVDIYKLIQTNNTRTKRAIFYDHKQLFVNNKNFDLTMNHVCSLLHETRKDLHILTTGKGLVMGDLSFISNDGTDVSCLLPTSIPCNIDDVIDFRTTAKFVLVVEKDAVFQRLYSEEFCSVYQPCIVVTAKGYPDFATRMFLLKLNEKLNLPLFALMDGDPHENCQLSMLRWIGVFPSEISELPIDQSKLLQLNTREKRKIELMLNRKLVKEDTFLTHQLEKMLKLGIKVEVEAICSLGNDYLTSTYLKLKFQKLMKNLLD